MQSNLYDRKSINELFYFANDRSKDFYVLKTDFLWGNSASVWLLGTTTKCAFIHNKVKQDKKVVEGTCIKK